MAKMVRKYKGGVWYDVIDDGPQSVCGIYVHDTAIGERDRPPAGQPGFICGRDPAHTGDHEPAKGGSSA